QLSTETVAYPLIDSIHFATKQSSIESTGTSLAESTTTDFGQVKLPPPASSTRSFGEVTRMRRSALDFLGGEQSMSLAQLSAILAVAAQPLSADFAGTRFIQLFLYAHRVVGLQPGIYRFLAERAGLEQIKSGDQRIAAAGLSLGQDLAGNACVAFSMIGDLDRAAGTYGDRGYRYGHFEAGAIGQRLYLAAEALGLGATGIGAFYDDEVCRHLSLTPKQRQVVYHFAIGYPVPDPRISASNDRQEDSSDSNALCPSVQRRSQHALSRLAGAYLFRIAHNLRIAQEFAFWDGSGIRDALFGISCASLDGKPNVNLFRAISASPQESGHVGMCYPLPDHRPRIKVGAFAHSLTCFVIVQ